MTNVIERAQYGLEALKKSGADKAQCVVTTRVTNEFNVDGGEFSLFRTLFDDAVSLTGFVDGKKGSAALNLVDDEAIEAAAKDCIASAQSGVADDAYDIAPYSQSKSFADGIPVIDRDKLFSRTKELMSDINERFPRIVLMQVIVSHVCTKQAYVNSNGVEYEKLSGQYDVSVLFSAHEGEKTSSFFGSGASTVSLDKPFIELGMIAKDLADVSNQVETNPVSGKFVGTLVLTPACFTEFIYYITSNFVFDSCLIDKTSLWKDKLGAKVANERFTLSAAPLDESIVCGERYTAEGFVSQNYDVIKNGVLENFMLSLYAANKTGNKRAPNSSMSFVVAAGDKSIDDIVKEIDHGILVGRFSGGSPNANGEFSGVAKNSFIIENGKIKSAVSETMISGNLAKMLFDIKDLSKERMVDGNSLIPYASFEGITISGK